ncbi:AtpZ/AtpI family protein [Actibacterium sp.]|uniref:AtpZ/AtpI family protein n=1 Tax=Actibacterium sp. TaxID=1872125 RepID=UPI003562CE57
MVDPADKERLAALETRIAELKKAQDPGKAHQEEHYSQANLAWRMVIELVAGLGIGFVIGYGLDTLFGTTPILMVIFIMLGFAAGVKTMLRSAAEIQEKASAEAGNDERD